MNESERETSKERKPKWETLGDWVGKVIMGMIREMSTEDLRQITKMKNEATETNCWWLVYDMRNVLCELANDEIKNRRYVQDYQEDR